MADDDIKDDFFKKCEDIPLGKLVQSDYFDLNYAMSSIELMDPKMDSGMVRFTRVISLKKAIQDGLYDDDDIPQYIATLDASIALLVAWLEGGCLTTTLWTNLIFTKVDEVDHYLYTPFANCVIHLVAIITHIVRNSCTAEEEDFNIRSPIHLETNIEIDIAPLMLRKVISDLAQDAEGKKNEMMLAVGARLEMFCLLLEILQWLTPPPDKNNESEDDIPQFNPKFDKAAINTRSLMNVTKALYETTNLGSSCPDGDGDFHWLPAIDPDVNRASLPSSFPRKVIIPDRKTALKYMMDLAGRLNVIAEGAPSSADDLTSLFFFARNFNINKSCVLSRSVLQLVMFPIDEKVFGDNSKSVSVLIETTLRDTFAPMVLQKSSPVYSDKICKELYNRFLRSMSSITLSVYQLFGCNMARQRDRLVAAIEDLESVQIEANRIEARTDQIMRHNDVTMIEAAPHSVTTFVFNNMIALITHYFELSLRMDIFVPYEFPYIYWYLGDILARWQIGTMERSQEMQMYGWKQNPLSTNVNPRRSKERQKAEEALKRRLQLNQYQMIHQVGLSQLAEGVVRMTLAMIKMGKIKVPKWADDSEKIRYEMRMAPFKSLGSPLFINYEQYKILSKTDEYMKLMPLDLIKQAVSHFESSRSHFERLLDKPELRDDSAMYWKVAKANFVGARLMTMQDMSTRNVEWFFSEECQIYPQLRIT